MNSKNFSFEKLFMLFLFFEYIFTSSESKLYSSKLNKIQKRKKRRKIPILEDINPSRLYQIVDQINSGLETNKSIDKEDDQDVKKWKIHESNVISEPMDLDGYISPRNIRNTVFITNYNSKFKKRLIYEESDEENIE